MDLKGAHIRNFYNITAGKSEGDERLRSPQLIKIPHYQRPYKWTPENIEKLIDDWASDIGDDPKYFAGSIVTVDDERSSIRCHQLIDGQQRFTTIFLANFVRFLLARVALRQGCAESGRAFETSDILKTFDEALRFLLLSKQEGAVDGFSSKVSALVGRTFKDASKGDGEVFQRRKELAKLICLPDIFEDDDEYVHRHRKMLKGFIETKELALDYDRSSFKSALVSALSRSVILLSDQQKPKLVVAEEEEILSDHERRFVKAIQCIFEKFSKLVDDSNTPFDRAVEILSKIDDFLSSISLCVVQTGNSRDAYTLFEVLNDRSLALDDLDLVKNLFYKRFVESNSKMDDLEIDNVVQELDDQWVNKIFGDEGVQKTKLIAYLGVVFITGNTSVVYNKSEDFRSAVNEYLNSLNSYAPEKIKSHFNVFYAVKVILDKVGVRFKLKDLEAVKAEFESDASVFKKTVLFLHARDHEGVLSGLINYVLKYIQNKHDGSAELSEDCVLKVVSELVKGNGIEEIEKQSKAFWQASMMAQTAREPRDFSVRAIEKFNYESTNNNLAPVSISHEEFSELRIQFRRWLDLWKYDDNHLRVRLLFARLLTLQPSAEKDSLIAHAISYSVAQSKVKDLQLDHIEPRKPNESNAGAYFVEAEREFFVDGLGNMMPLTAEVNSTRGNTPAKDAFDFYSEAGLKSDHPLVKLTKDLFDDHSESIGEKQVPKASFFRERKAELVNMFGLAVMH